MAPRDPRAAEAARLKRIAAGEQSALAKGGVVLGSVPQGLPTEAELLKLAAAQMANMQAEIDGLRGMGAAMAGIVSTLAELIVGNTPGFQRREDGSFDVLLDADRVRAVQGYQVTYEQQDTGAMKLSLAPPPPPEAETGPALALVEDPPEG